VKVARFPLVGSYTNRGLDAEITDTTDQIFTNGYPETATNPITGKSRVCLNKRPGRAQSAELTGVSAGLNAAVAWTSNSGSAAPFVFAFRDSGNDIRFYDHTGTQVGGDVATASTSDCTFLSETLISTTGNLTASIIDGTTLENWFFPEGGAWTQITDGDFPANVQAAHCHMDGYMFVITRAGVIHNSDVNSLSAWTAGVSIAAQSMPDNGVGIARYRNLVVAFGDYSMEFFYNAGNATGSPLSRVDGAIKRVGAIRPSSFNPTIRSIGDTVYWLGRDAEAGTCGVYRLDGFQPKKISTTTVDKLVTKGAITKILGGFTLGGLSHIAFAASGVSVLCFCLETGFWWYFVSDISFTAFLGGRGTTGITVATASNSNRIHTFDPSTPVWQDAGASYTMTAQTDPLDHGTHKRKFYNRVALMGDTQSSGAVSVSWSDDDYASFSAARSIDFSSTRRSLERLGMSRRRAWKFEHSANTPCRLEAVEIEYEEGES